MLGSNKEKDLTKAEMEKKVQAWRTINEVLVQANSKFMDSLKVLLVNKRVEHEELKVKLESGNGTEDDNAEYLFLGGYIKCLEDVTAGKVN